MLINKITDYIGFTPTLKLQSKINDWVIYIKLEKFNPGGSMKDRMARNMVDAAEKSGDLKFGGTIVESSSGNTGTGLAMVAAERGYKFIVVIDNHTSTDKIRTLRALGADVRVIGEADLEGEVATAEREAIAAQIAQDTSGAVLMAQHINPANSEAYLSTANEIISEIGPFDILVGAVGTGGSLCGTSQALREKVSNISVLGVEPKGSIIFGSNAGPYYQSGSGVPQGVSLGTIIDFNTIDEGCVVDDIAAFNTCRYFGHQYGLLLGGSSGAVIYAAAQRLQNLNGKGKMVILAGDGGEKYLDTIFNDEWMINKGLLDRSVETDISNVFTSEKGQVYAAA